ncbi:hypothetical protein DEO72_LG9g204 [Vigna unguiculata]|uniref:Uncharacterized protein n=1 Tax=Vigna unguiculata TaxID=3917 RepID=A0A4D6MX38_VIGUN|nr:hypothetical protein DEO72_LG9g204 [Vigna unguiculata]
MWGRTDILAQASSSCLSENIRGSPKGHCLQTRLSESLQLKRGNLPRLSEGA